MDQSSQQSNLAPSSRGIEDAQSYRAPDLYLGDGIVYVHMKFAKAEGDAIRVNTKKAIEPNQWIGLVLATYDGSGEWLMAVKMDVDAP